MTQKVDDLWWEGTTLCMEIEGRVWSFKDARAIRYEPGEMSGEGITITPVEFVAIKIDE